MPGPASLTSTYALDAARPRICLPSDARIEGAFGQDPGPAAGLSVKPWRITYAAVSEALSLA